MPLSAQAQLTALLSKNPQLRVVGMAQSPATAPAPAPKPRPEEALLAEIEDLAERYGWVGEYTWNAQGDDTGLHCMLVRPQSATSPGRLLCAYLLRSGQKLSAAQDRWQHLLRHSLPGLEVYAWEARDLDVIGAILARKAASGP